MGHIHDSEWVAVDYIVCSAATTPTFASGGAGARGYVPDGNKDLAYRIRYDLIGGASGAIGRIELQAGTTNQSGVEFTADGTTTAGTALTNLGLVCNSGTASSRHQGEWVMYGAATGNQRTSLLDSATAGAAQRVVMTGGRYNDTTTNITSIRFNITTGAVSGRIWLFVKNPQKGGF